MYPDDDFEIVMAILQKPYVSEKNQKTKMKHNLIRKKCVRAFQVRYSNVRIQRHVPRCFKLRGLVNGPPSSEVFRSIWTNCLKSYVTIKKENGSSINQ